MKKAIAIAVTGIFCLHAGGALAQQGTRTETRTTQQTQPGAPSSGASTAAGAAGSAPVAGTATLGVTVTEMQAVVLGWSAKRDLLDKTVFNDQKDRIGKIDDLIVTPSGNQKTPSLSYAIIGVGGFLGIGKHDVAIPMTQLRLQNGQLILPGATKASLKALPAFEYARR